MAIQYCKCGHADWDHYPKGKTCQGWKMNGTIVGYCICSKFRPKV